MKAEELKKDGAEETNDASDELYQRFVFTADKGQEPFRIDKFLMNRIEGATRNKLQQAINALPPRRRQVFQLCKLDGKSYEEAALELGLSTSTISDHIVKATHFIRIYCYKHHEILGAVCVSALFTGL